MTKMILLNGPIGCGKTAAVQRLRQLYPDLVERRAKDKLFELTISFFNIPEEEFYRIYKSRKLKEQPNEWFTITREAALRLSYILGKSWEHTGGGIQLSCREAMIYVSECVCKPTFGKHYFGQCRADDMDGVTVAIDDSAGFAEEIPPLVDKIGIDNILLIRVSGRGTFDGDSRSFLHPQWFTNYVEISNEGTLEEFLEKICDVSSQFIGKSLEED